MLETLAKRTEQLAVFRLSAVDKSAINALLELGAKPADFPKLLSRLRSVGTVVEVGQLIPNVFRASTNPTHFTPFNPTRFTDGTKAVFYSALEESTAIAEIRYWREKDISVGEGETLPTIYSMYRCEFEGATVDLVPYRGKCPEITSRDESGYPRCREIAEEVRNTSIDGLRTPSARESTGICTPIFSEDSLTSVPTLASRSRFQWDGVSLQFDVLEVYDH
jgi:hypothetical protein